MRRAGASHVGGRPDVSVSGGATTSNLWTIDGANNNDVGSNRTILVYPSVDAIEEFKIQRNNYGAEFGQAGGGSITFASKSGRWFTPDARLTSTRSAMRTVLASASGNSAKIFAIASGVLRKN